MSQENSEIVFMDGIVALKPQFFNESFTPSKAVTLWPFLLVEKLWLKKILVRILDVDYAQDIMVIGTKP